MSNLQRETLKLELKTKIVITGNE